MRKAIFFFTAVLFLFSTAVTRAQTFTNYHDTDGLADNFVCGGVAIDHNGYKWFGTANGVCMFDDATWTTWTTTDGLPDNFILCIAVDDTNNIWVGTNFGVSVYDGATWTNYDMSDGLVDNSVKYIGFDGSDVLFATGSGLSVFTGSSWTTYTSSNGMPSDDANYLFRNADGSVWVGTMMGGLSMYDAGAFSNNISTSIMANLPDNNIFAIAKDNSQNLWIGTWYGLTKVDNSLNWVVNYDTTTGLRNNYVRDMKVDSYGDVWIGMFADYNGEGGVSVYNGLGFTNFGISDGLADKQVVRLAIDDNDDVWVATGNGVTKISGVSSLSENAWGEDIQIYHNPASDHIRINKVTSGSEIFISDISGRVLVHDYLNEADNELDVSALNAGWYILQIISENGKICRKLCVN